MEKYEVLEKLQDAAREIANLEKWLQSNGENRLAEYACVWRLINFKVQKLIDTMPQTELENALTDLQLDLFSQAEYYREHKITALQELYGAAMDGFIKTRNLISAYLQ